MTFMKCKKLILPAVLVAMLASIPVHSNAYTANRTVYTVGPSNSTNSVVQSSNNYTYTVNVNPYETTNSQYRNTYVVSRGNYRRPQVNPGNSVEVTPTPVEKPNYVQPQPAPQPQPQPKPNESINTGSTSNSSHSLSASEIELVQYVNSARQEAGLQPLGIDVDLSYVARLKSQDMNDNKYFSHDSPTYGSPFEMMTKFGISYRGAAENIAKTTSVQAAHNGFMRSQGHKENILNPIYTHIGIGISNGHYTQMFIRK